MEYIKINLNINGLLTQILLTYLKVNVSKGLKW